MPEPAGTRPATNATPKPAPGPAPGPAPARNAGPPALGTPEFGSPEISPPEIGSPAVGALAAVLPPDPVLTVGVCTSAEEFGALASEWGRLYGRCSSATPFQTHAWLYAWWLAYGTRRFGEDRGLRVILVRSDAGDRPQAGAAGGHGAGPGAGGTGSNGTGAGGTGGSGGLVAAAAMMRTCRRLPALVPLGGAISDFSDVLLDDAHAERAAPVLAGALAEAAGSALIDFREVRPGAAVERVYACWPGPRRALPDSLCLELPAVPMDGLVARLPSSRRQRVRANLRRLAALEVERRVVAPEEVPGALRALLGLHRAQWQGRGRKVTGEHLRPRFAAHLERAVRTMAGRGEAALTEFRVGRTVVVVDLTLLGPRLTGGYLYGADPWLRARKVDVGTLLMQSAALHTTARPGPSDGGGVLSMLRGAEPYKHHWRPEPVVNQRFLLARRHAGALLSAAAHEAAARARVKGLLRGQREATGHGR